MYSNLSHPYEELCARDGIEPNCIDLSSIIRPREVKGTDKKSVFFLRIPFFPFPQLLFIFIRLLINAQYVKILLFLKQ